jgi:hypothetical protein
MRYFDNASEGKPGTRPSHPHGDGQSTGLEQPTAPVEPSSSS